MNAIDMARRAYAPTNISVRTARGTEHDALAQITGRLVAADRAGDFNALARAVHDNRRFWNLVALHVADPANALPKELRARLFYLAQFSEKEGRAVLGRRGGVEALVDINNAVMHGLNGEDGR